MKKIISKKKLVAGVLSAVLMFGMTVLPVNAESVTTNTYNTSSTYVLYVREIGSTDLLGTMTLSKDTSYVYNTFTASQPCKETTTFVSNMSSSYSPKTVTSLAINASVIAKKYVRNATNVYGYCTVEYND